MENLERYYEILGVKPGATIKEIREAYRYLQEEYYPDYCSKSPQRQEKAREALREIYSAYKKLKVSHKDQSTDTGLEEEPIGAQVDNGSADTETALDLTEALWIDPGQDADKNKPAENLDPVTVEETEFSDGKTDELRTLTEKLAELKIEIDRLTAEKSSVEKVAAEELAALKTDLENLAGGKAQAEKALAEAMAIAGREADKAAAEREAAEKRLAEEVATARAEAARTSNEKAADEQKMREELAASKALIERLISEKEAVGMAAAEELAELKAELERTAAAEEAVAEEAAAAKAEAADLAAEKKDAGKALAEARAAAQREAERFAAERVTVAKEFAGQLGAIKAEVNRITEEKAAVEKELNEKLRKAKTDFERLSAVTASAAKVASSKQDVEQSRTGFPLQSNPTLVKVLKGLSYGGLLAALGILAHAIVTPRHSTDRPALMRPAVKSATSGKTVQSPAGTKQAVAPAPIVVKKSLPASSNANSPATVSTVVKAAPTASSGKKEQNATASRKKSPRTLGHKRLATTKSAHEHAETKKENNSNPAVVTTKVKYQRKSASITRPAATTVTRAAPSKPPAKASAYMDERKTQNKYKVDMYPFARY